MQEGDESALRSSLMNIQMSHNHEVSSSGAIQTDPPERSESFGFRTGHERVFLMSALEEIGPLGLTHPA